MSDVKKNRPQQSALIEGQLLRELQERLTAETRNKEEAKRTARWALVGLGAVAVMAVAAGVIVATRFPLEKYLYTDNAKEICEAQVQDLPLVTSNTVMDFAKECVLDMDTFAHDTFEKDLTRMANRCFTPGFRKKFMEMDWLADRVSTVRSGFLRVSSQTSGTVVIADSGATADGYKWVVQVPVKRTFRQGDSPRGSNERVYDVEVYRVLRDAYNPVGLGINAIYEKSGVLK